MAVESVCTPHIAISSFDSTPDSSLRGSRLLEIYLQISRVKVTVKVLIIPPALKYQDDQQEIRKFLRPGSDSCHSSSK